jgi:protein-S-isoprenylcysteine O-methyltransferase Ste14
MPSSMTRGSSRWSEFRARGGLWVLAQSVLIAGIAVGCLRPQRWPDELRLPLSVVGGISAGFGLGFAVWAYRSLGSSFTVFTRPPVGGRRVDTGPYRLVRHPIYGGGLLLLAGISLVYSVTSLALTAGLAALWRAKSAAEERFLLERFPDYAAYRERTPRRFWPYLY